MRGTTVNYVFSGKYKERGDLERRGRRDEKYPFIVDCRELVARRRSSETGTEIKNKENWSVS